MSLLDVILVAIATLWLASLGVALWRWLARGDERARVAALVLGAGPIGAIWLALMARGRDEPKRIVEQNEQAAADGEPSRATDTRLPTDHERPHRAAETPSPPDSDDLDDRVRWYRERTDALDDER